MHAHSGGRNSESLVCLCAQQPATAPTDNFALLHCTFQQGSAVLPTVVGSACSNVHLQQLSSELHAPPLLQPAAAPLGKSALIPHHLALTSSALYASLPPPEAATLHHLPRSPPLLHVQATGRYYNVAPLYGLTQDLSTTWLFSLRTRLLQHPPLSFEQIYAPPLDDTQQHRLATQHRRPIASPHSCISSARLSHHQKLHPSTNPPPTLASASIVRAHTPPPATISSSIVGHNSALRSRQPPSPFSAAPCAAHNW